MANHYNGLICQAYYILHDRQKAEDIVQEACELFLTSKKEMDNPAGWLHITVKNLACALKNSDSKVISLEAIPDRGSKLLDPLDNLLDKETKELLHKAIWTLPDIYRSAIMLYYFDGKSAEEAAKLLEIGTATFLSRLYRARRYLYGLLGGHRRDALD